MRIRIRNTDLNGFVLMDAKNRPVSFGFEIIVKKFVYSKGTLR